MVVGIVAVVVALDVLDQVIACYKPDTANRDRNRALMKSLAEAAGYRMGTHESC